VGPTIRIGYMEVNRESFTFYRKWMRNLISSGVDKEVRCEVYEAIIDYLTTGHFGDLQPISRVFLNSIKEELDNDIATYVRICERNRNNAKNAGAPKGNRNASKQSTGLISETQTEPENNPKQSKTIQNNPKQSTGLISDKESEKTSVSAVQQGTFVEKIVENKPDSADSGVNEPKEEKEKFPHTPIKEYKEENCANIDIGQQIEIVEVKSQVCNTPKPKSKEDIAAAREKRAKAFYDSIVPFLAQYPKEMLREFYEYWTEPTKSGTQMRFELERTWSLSRRLGTWDRNNTKFRSHAISQQTSSRGQQVGNVWEGVAGGVQLNLL